MKPFRLLSTTAVLIVALVAVAAASARANGNGTPEISVVVPSVDTLLEYKLPVLPFNLFVQPSGVVWFNPDTGRSLGRLDPTLGQVTMFQGAASGSLWGIVPDGQGNIWYSCYNCPIIGRLNPTTGQISEWSVASNHYGIAVDQTTGDVWYTTRDANPGIHKLSPSTNTVTVWTTSPYVALFDLTLDPAGNVWVTVQPDNQSVLRLDPTTNQLTLWALPHAAARPFRLVAQTDSVWLTEHDPSGNAIAHIIPSSNTLSEYTIPTANCGPWTLVEVAGDIWFAEEANKLGRLDPSVAVPRTTVVTPSTVTAPTSSRVVVPAVSTATQNVQIAPTTPRLMARYSSAGFTEFGLPPWSEPNGLARDQAGQYVWVAYSTDKTIGRMSTTLPPADTPTPTRTLTPTLTRTPTRTLTPTLTPTRTRTPTLTATPAPALSTDPGQLSFLASPSLKPMTATVQVLNSSSLLFSWTASESVSWLNLSPTSGSALAGSPGQVTVTVNLAGLPYGLYTADITISSATAGVMGSPKKVPVRLSYQTTLRRVFLPVIVSAY